MPKLKPQDPQKVALRNASSKFLKENIIKLQTGDDVKNLIREMIGSLIDASLDGELDDYLGYDRYDYQAKETDNSRNGHSKKTILVFAQQLLFWTKPPIAGSINPQFWKCCF